MKLDRLYIETRLAKLKINPSENGKLIRKWERMLRRVDKTN